MPVQMPGYLDYDKMMGMNPQAYGQAMDQLGLARQFAAQDQQQEEAKTLSMGLANQFAAQENPLKIKQQILKNDAQSNENVISGVNSRNSAATEESQLAAMRQKQLTSLNEDQLKAFQAQAEMEYSSEDPKVQASGQRKLMFSKAELDRRNNFNDKKELTNMEISSRERVAAGNNAATLGAAQIGANSRMQLAKQRQSLGGSVEDALMKAKTFQQQSVVYEAAAQKARQAGDDESAQHYAQLAQRAAVQDTNRVTAGADARQVGQVDVGAMGGIPTRQSQQLPVPPMPGVGQQPLQRQAPAVSAPPPFAEVMKMYPGRSEAEIRAAYQKKFGVKP